MKTSATLVGFVLLVTGVCREVRGAQAGAASAFRGPKVAEAGEVTYPASSVAYGFVALEVTVDTTGAVEAVKAVRGVVSLTSEAIRAVKEWRFEPAAMNGSPVRSKTTVVVVFCPPVDNPPAAHLTLVTGQAGEEKQDVQFSPPGLVEATYPKYPVASVAAGTVVLELEIDADGKATTAKVVRDVVSLTPQAMQAVKGWKFESATLDGRPLPSKVTAAFLFQRPPYPDTR